MRNCSTSRTIYHIYKSNAASVTAQSVKKGEPRFNYSEIDYESMNGIIRWFIGGRRSPAVACWASDHWVASSNPLRSKFRH